MAVDKALVSQLRPLAVKQYAESRAWLSVPLESVRFWLLRHPDHHLRQLQIPMDASDVGFVDAMRDVIARLSEIEGRPADAVLADLLWPDADILRVRIASPASAAGQLSLASDVELREGVRRALLASACSVVKPARYHPRLSRSEADAFLAACRAGQTERGSYVVKVICPLHAGDLPNDETAAPFTRQVTTYLMRSTARLVEDIENDQLHEYEIDIAADAAAPLSWNLCDALLRMRPEGDQGQVELATRWAADRRFSPPANVPARVSIKAEYFQAIEQVARVLRPTREAREQQLIGTVEQLSGTVDDEGRRAGEVQFTLLEDGEPLRVKAILDVEQYEVAMRAHQGGETYVVLHGVLHRGTRTSRIEPLRSLALLEDEARLKPHSSA